MAGENIIIRTLIRAGLKLDDQDLAKAKASLKELGQTTFDLDPAKKQAKELGKLLTQVKKDKTLLDRAAIAPDRLTRGQQQRLPDAFGRLKTFQDQLGKLANTLRSAGNANQVPMFQHLTGLEKVMASLGATSRNIAPLIDNVTKSFKANATAVRQAQTDAVRNQRLQDSQARTAETLERARRTRAIQSPEGRKAFLTAARGNTGAIETAASAKQGRAFAASALAATERAVQLERSRPVQDPRTIERAERKLALSAQAFSDLDQRAGQLTSIEALRKKQAQFERDSQIEDSKTPGAKKALHSALRGDLTAITASAEASKGAAFALKELNARKQIHALTEQVFGEESKEAQRTGRQLGALSEAYAGLTKRVTDLAEVEKLRKTNNRKADQLALKEAEVAQTRATRGRLLRPGRTALEQAGGIGAGVDGFGNVDAAKKAQAFVKGELGDLIKLQNAYARTFGVTSDQAKTAAVEVERYGEFLRKLETRIQSLGATADTQKQIDKHAEAVRTSEERRRNNALKLANGKQLLEEANGDFTGYTDRRALARARNFANAELTQLRAQQESAARTVGVSGSEYITARKEGDEFAKTIALIDQRLDHLATTIRAMPRLSTFDSANKHAAGKRIYETARENPNGLAELEPEQAKQARDYVRARRNEQAAYGKGLSKSGASKADIEAAATATRALSDELGILTKAATPASQGMGLLQTTLRSFLKYAVGYSALYGLAAAVTALGKSMVDLQTELLDIQAVTGSTDAQMSKLTDTVTQVARTSKFSLLDLTKATKVLAQAGISVEELNTSLKSTADFAAATGANLEVAADLLSTTRSVFKELSDDTISNQLAKAINVSKLTAEDLKTILSLGAQTAKSFGLTSEQFLAAVATLRNAGLKQSTAATGLRQGMLEIFSPDAKLIKALQARYHDLGEEMGAEAVRARFFAFSRGRSPLIAALTELKRLGFNDEGAMDLSRAFDIRSTNAIKAMIANLEELAANEGKITFGRAAAAGAATTIEGLNASFTRLLSTINAFTYSRSEGVLGFLTDAIQGLDRAIQKLDEWDLKRRSMGELSLSGPKSIFGSADSAFNPLAVPRNYIENKIKGLFPSKQTPAEAVDQASASAQTLANRRANFEQFDNSARAADIRLAKLGETVGSAGDGLVKIERVSDDLNLTIARVFGPGLEGQREQLVKLAQSYSNLTPSERAVRIKELTAKYKQLEKFDPVQLDRSLASIAGMGTAVDGYLKGQADSLSDGLVKSHEVLDKLKGKKATSVAEIEAVATEEVARRFPELLDIMRGDSKLAAGQQITIMQMASQAWSDLVRSKGGAGFLQEEAKLQAQALLQKIKAISLTRNKDTAGVDVQLAIQSLETENKKLGKAAIDRMQQIKEALIAAADKLAPGANKSLLETGVKEITKGQEITGAKSVAEIDARVAINNELFEKVRTNPDFRTNLEQMPDTTVGREAALSYTAPGSQGIPMEDVLNGTQAYKDFLDLAKTFNDTYLKQIETRKAYAKELKKGQELGDAVEKHTTEFNDFRVNKQFPEARGALNAKINAQIAVENDNLAEAERQRVANLSNTDVDKDKTILKNELDARAKIAKLEIERAKELEQINREEAKVELGRGQRQKAGEQARLKGTLDSATNLTPQGSIDSTIQQFDKVNAERLALFEEQLKQQGTQTDLSEAEIEERRKLLAPYKEQAAYLDMVFRRERQTRDDIDSQLALTLSSGNLLTDARLEDKGLTPGDRTQRRDYLVNRQNLLLDKRANAVTTLDRAKGEVRDRYAKSLADPDNRNVAESLARARAEVNDLTQVIAEANTELGNTGLALERVTGTWESGFKRAFDPNLIQRSLEQSESSFEHFGEVINDHVVDAIEGIGDAFADAVVEGKSLGHAIDDVFSQLSKETLRTLIKTLSNETIGSLTGTLFGSKEPGQQGLLPSLFARLGLGGSPKKGEATHTTAEATQPVGFMDRVYGSLTGDTVSGEDGSCLPKETAEAMKKVAAGPGLDKLVETEGKGFFEELGGGFVGLLDNVTSGFGKVFGNLGGLLGLGSSSGAGQATGLFSLGTLAAGILAGGAGGSATYKGAYGFAGGGIIHGPGTGTSDSIPAYLTGPSGQHQELRVSNGESILTAKATAALGADFIHSVNNGRMLNARSSSVMTDQAHLASSTPAAPVTTNGRPAGGSEIWNVHLTPAQSRMRMGDWLHQQILDERAKR
jgi:TP901 family phage tail tape measure protein